MHELSIAQSIVELAEEQARAKSAKKIIQIELAIGELSGIELDALEFAWPVAIENTMLANTELKIDHIKGEAYCHTCEKKFELANMFDPCPFCQSFLKDVIRGKELAIKSIEVEV